MSRFISAGATDEEPTERDEAWSKAQQQIEAARQQTQAKPLPGEQEGGKSLYETLQANKAAKQEAFEEQAKLKNQFRSLDDDEVEFLDSVLESTRAKEAEVQKATRDQLDAFRRQQEDAEKAARGQEGGGGDREGGAAEGWTAGPRKRKKGREGLLGGVKLRRTSTAEKAEVTTAASPGLSKASTTDQPGSVFSPGGRGIAEELTHPSASATGEPSKPSASPPPPPPNTTSAALGLGAYSSDEDE